MHRLACVLLVLTAACTDDGKATGAATLTGEMATVKSAYSKPFKDLDGSGATVLGWKIVFTTAPAGTGCKAESVTAVADVEVWTSQAPASGHTVADLATGDISIILTAPPTAPAMGEVAIMGADDVSNVEGSVTLTGVGKNGTTVIDLEGSVAAAGMDANNAGVTLGGMFVAPVCN